MNNWKIETFLKTVIAIQLVVWGVISLDTIGVDIPILRQIIGFVYLTFVPGIVILRVLKLHKLDVIETIVYTVGLSIATLMFTGLFMCLVYPFFGVSEPISIAPLTITISLVVLILCVLCYVRDEDFSDPSNIEVKDILSPPALFLCLLPFLSVFGTYLVNFYQTNILLLFLISMIALIVILVAFDRFIPQKLYPLAILMIALSLLYHTSLLSQYIRTGDIVSEYFLSNLVVMNSNWDLTLPYTVNAMLSIVMLAPIYSEILALDLTWVLKIVYPALYSFVPVGVYQVYKEQINEKVAFFSAFFFIAFFPFYTTMTWLARQEIAELFFVMLIMLLINDKMNRMKRAILSVIFALSLIVSHYGLSYFYMFFYLILTFLLLSLLESPVVKSFLRHFAIQLNRLPFQNSTPSNSEVIMEVRKKLSKTYVAVYIVFALSWYIYIASSHTFISIVNIFDQIHTSILTEWLAVGTREAEIWVVMGSGTMLSFVHEVYRFMHQITLFFIFIGLIRLVMGDKRIGFKREYTVMSIVSAIILLLCILLPHFSTQLNVERTYHITLSFLAPFCILGGDIVFKWISKLFKFASFRFPNRSASTKFFVLLVLIPYFLFNCGFVYEVIGDNNPNPMPVSMVKFKTSENDQQKAFFYIINTQTEDVFSIRWASKNIEQKSRIYADWMSRTGPFRSYGSMFMSMEYIHLLRNPDDIDKNAFIYLNYFNVKENRIVGDYTSEGMSIYNTTEISQLPGRNKIYSNGGSAIYR